MKNRTPNKLLLRLGALVLVLVMVLGSLPADTFAAPDGYGRVVGNVTTVADPDTVSRPVDIYWDNTFNAGKVTVGKSVSDSPVTLSYGGNTKTFTPGTNNFIVTSSQTSQVVGLATEQAVPVDVVFVLDTSGSMDRDYDNNNKDRAHEMVEAANSAIATLMAANPLNRVGVVAFSSQNGSIPSAQVLSSLATYTGAAATNHLQWVNSQGTASQNGSYIAGRNTTGTNGSLARRVGHDGGTNIHAGVALGGQQLLNAATTTAVLEDGSVVTRMPFLVILSDGQPTFMAADEDGSTWYNPSYSNNLGNGSNPYEGAGFIVALTAAYYKDMISQHYYGNRADENNRCGIYTLGVELDELEGDNMALAQITMDPATYTTGDYAQTDNASYWNYGNTYNDNNKNTTHGWKTYWEAYTASTAATFPIRVNSGSGEVWVGQGPEGTGAPARLERPDWRDYRVNGNNVDWNAYNAAVDAYEAAEEAWQQWHDANYDTLNYTPYIITADSITATKSHVKSIAYNDGYFSTSAEAGQPSLNDAFNNVITEIQKKALASPTHVNTVHGADFSGYVTYTDPIGEYMEVKGVHGILAEGHLFEGQAAAQKLSQWTSLPETDEFKIQMRTVLRERCKVTGATMTDAQMDAFLQAAVASDNQANYDAATGAYDNSLVWWGQSYTAAGEEDPQVKWLGFADNDSYEYITTTQAPEGATHVCRSYYYIGTDSGEEHNLLHFVVRVQRSLTAPYQETVVISAPASLLSMEKIFVTEKSDAQGNKTYEAEITPAEPARVVYEVGLRSDINAYNVAQIVGADTAYTGETAVFDNTAVATNYADGKYIFYTNDWDRTQAEGEHHRAMTKATFDAAASNSFYAYTEDTLLYTKQGENYVPYTGSASPVGGSYYYAREYFDWTGKTPTNGVYPAEKKVAYIPVELPSNAPVKQENNQWYIPKGVFKASSLVSENEDVYKTENGVRVNPTQTAEIVAHPHRTTGATNSHYTVLLGNNGKLTLEAEKTKSVSIDHVDPERTDAEDGDGKLVMVGDTLTYSIKVVNPEDAPAKAEVTDTLPKSTTYVENSASDGGVYADGKITWNLDLAAGETKTVSFKVTVANDLVNVVTIDNTAYVKLDNGFEYQTNTTKNPPEGKRVVDTTGKTLVDGDQVQVQDILVYRIMWQNDAGADATVVITDIIPEGTEYVEGSADHNGVYSVDSATGERKLTWTINAKAGFSGVVSFRVVVVASAESTIENEAKIKVGENAPRVTNKTTATVKTGDLELSKTVKAPEGAPALDANSLAFQQSFTLNITEINQSLNGTFDLYKGEVKEENKVNGGITFTNGTAALTIKHGETFTIEGLPVGAIFSVTETAKDGYTPAYSVNGVKTDAAEGRLTLAENGNAVAVENTYAPIPASFQMEAKKVLDTKVAVEDMTFGFTAQACDASGVVKTGDDKQLLTGEVTVSSEKKEAAVAFSPMTFATTGTYHYLVDELPGGVVGVVYDQSQYLITIAVTDDGSGQLQANATVAKRTGDTGAFTAADDEVFTNKYVPLAVDLTLTGTKTLNGRTLRENEFSFEVRKDSATGEVVSTGYNKADGTIVFKPITYKEAGTYKYVILEVKGGLEGVTYATEVRNITVNVTNDNGQLKAVLADNSDAITFTNTFEPKDTRVVLSATKKVVNKENTAQTVAADAFSFVVLDSEGKTVATGKNAQGGAVTFSPIGYSLKDLAGVQTVNGIREKLFTYTIKEVIPDLGADPYMDYDETSHTVTVKVSYDTNTGVLTATETYAGGAAPIFTNKQYPNSIEVTPAATKTTSGTNNATFSFSVINTESGHEAGTGVGVANGAVTFTKLSFSQPGTYKYWIQESNAGKTQHGITYDNTRYLMVVDITLTNGELDKSVKYYSSATDGSTAIADYTTEVATPAFENTYEAEAQIAVTATKVLTGRSEGVKAGEFGFILTGVEGTPSAGTSVSGTVAAGGKITFADLYYDQNDVPQSESKVFQYTMSEVIPTSAKVPGVSYDTTTHTVYINVTHQPTGTMDVFVSDAQGNQLTTDPNATGVTFTNTYSVQTGATLTVNANKKLTGRTLKAGEFSFALYHVVDGVENQVATATNDANGNIQFVRHYPATVLGTAKSMTVTYRIREINGGLGGVTYDPSYEEFTVTISDNNQGGLVLSQSTVTIGTSADPAFQNSYAPTGTEFTPKATKSMQVLTLKDNMFSFVVKDASGKIVTTGENRANGHIEFAPIGYTAPGTYTYTISEVEGNLDGVQYTDTTYDLIVEVKDMLDGTMSATGTYKLSGTTVAEKDVVFTNTFVPTNATVNLMAKKVLNGRDMIAGEFSFVATDDSGKVVATGGNAAANNRATADVTFSNIGYSYELLENEPEVNGIKTKTFDYIISEQATSQGGVTFSDAVYYVRVTVTYNSTTGEMKADPKYYSDENRTQELTADQVKFTNEYKPAEVTLTLPVDKTLLNKQIEAGEFRFNLLDSAGAAIDSASNDATGKVKFLPLRFTTPGVYKYTISEGVRDPEKKDLYTLDDPFTVIVTVKDDLQGNLVANAAYYVNYVEGQENTNLGGVEFINQYTAPPITVPLTEAIGATKTLDGRDLTANDKFTFTVYDNQNNVVSTGTNDATGKITFTDFTFKQAGLYHYWIVENATNLGGVTIDSRVWEVRILVRYNEKDANLIVDGKQVPIGQLYVAKDDVNTYLYNTEISANAESAPAFVNTYTPAPVNVTVKATKTLTGRDLRNQEFLFQMVRSDGVVVGEAYNDAQGNVQFDLHYTTAGVRTYKLVEVKQDTAGITYDETEFKVTVNVTDNLKGQLEAKVTYEQTPAFANTYTPAPVKVDLEAKKTYSGHKAYDGGIFDFQLVNENDASEVYTTKNDSNGVAKFQVELTAAGTYTYVMTEVAGTDTDHFDYDPSKYIVTIHVTDDLMGKLQAEVVYGTNDALAPVFVNNYKADPYILILEGDKTLTGRDMEKDEFSFVVHDSTGKQVATATNDADGKLTFSAISLPDVGEYILKVTEVKGNAQNMTYDATEFTVTATVTNNNGVLEADVRYPEGGVVFRNTYKVPETTQPTQPTRPGGSPDTGDHNSMLGFGTMAVLSLGAAMALVLLPKRKKQRG